MDRIGHILASMTDDRGGKGPVRRRDAEGRIEVGATWESLIDRQIREAMEEGKFKDLPHHGQPLPSDDNPYAGDMGLAFKMLKDAGYAPPWIVADKEVRELLARRDALLARVAKGALPTAAAQQRDRRALTQLVEQTNAAIAKVNSEAPVAGHRPRLVLAAELARYDEACRR
jgi:Domain of unknown function (DUF1992)